MRLSKYSFPHLAAFQSPAVRCARLIAPLAACAILLSPASAAPTWPRPAVIPLPESVAGVTSPTVSLNGTWKFTMKPPANFWDNTVDPAAWSDIKVPGEPWMQGFAIDFDVEYPYKQSIDIPADFAGKRIFLRFDGVYSLGRVWINGNFAGQHNGGFTSWQLDITDWVTPGSPAWLTVAITDDRHDPSFASGYAGRYLGPNDLPHRIGGILRDVTLFALPTTYLTRLHAETDLDATYQDATLKLEVGAQFPSGGADATVHYRLTDPGGAEVPLTPSETTLTPGSPAAIVSIPVADPLKWDAEHPHLYTLEAELRIADQAIQTLKKRIGFREIEIDGNRMLVNGVEIKLRGGCRHSIHPLAGRSDLLEMDEKDVLLYKQANLNHVRTSHYPATENFLNLCDQYGLYVEEEIAICWVDQKYVANGILNGLASSPAARPYFMTAISETLERDKSHPSIIIWSIGNENYTWGVNFEEVRDYARWWDPTRPLKTGHNHYPTWKKDTYLDIDSYHYPSLDWNFNKTGKPYLFDEFAHVKTYYKIGSIAEIDPNIRNFWGESLKRFWEAIFPSQGSLGGAIWGTIDDVFLTPDAAIGYGRWGIFDGWRRTKPEYWLTKKGYSPIRIANAPLGNPGAGSPLQIPVSNWFDHTNFNELEITWEAGGEKGTLTADLAPRASGQLVIPARAWQSSDSVRLRFNAKQPGYSYLVDEFLLPLEERKVTFPGPQGPAPAVVETSGQIRVTGSDFEIVFDKASGSIVSGTYKGELLITGGPFLNLTPYSLPAFALSSISVTTDSPEAVVKIAGTHGGIQVAYVLRIDGTGFISTTYSVTNPPAADSYAEVGVAFKLKNTIDMFQWDRKGLYSVYPVDHIGRNHGVTPRKRPGPEQAYRQEPVWPWALDMKEFHQHGPNHAGYGMTNDFRSAKEAIYQAAAVNSQTGNRVRVESDGSSHAVRMGAVQPTVSVIDDRDPSLTYHGSWSTFEDPANILGTETYSNKPGTFVEYAFTGTSVRWISANNQNLGKVDIHLDGVLVAEAVDAYSPSKQYQQVLFERGGLADGPHTLKIVVRGDKNPSATNNYAMIDGFSNIPVAVEGDSDLILHINRQWTYEFWRGNYDRSSKIASGFSDTVHLRLMGGSPPKADIQMLDRSSP